MDFLKNLDKEFIISGSYKISDLRNHVKLGDARVKIIDISLDNIQVKLSEVIDLDKRVEQILQNFKDSLIKDVEKFKKIANKVVTAWENNPENFKQQTGSYSKDTYINTKLLTDKEYHQGVFCFFGKLSIYSSDYSSFATGCGNNTYYAKNVYIKNLANIDNWIETVFKTFDSKMKTKIKNSIFGFKIDLSIKDAIKYLSIPTTELKKKQIKKSVFPITFSGDDLNWIMNYMDDNHIYIDQEFINLMRTKAKVDISLLDGWELEEENDGEHIHDGDNADYTVTFTSPEGNKYVAYDNHNLVGGWSFDGIVIPE